RSSDLHEVLRPVCAVDVVAHHQDEREVELLVEVPQLTRGLVLRLLPCPVVPDHRELQRIGKIREIDDVRGPRRRDDNDGSGGDGGRRRAGQERDQSTDGKRSLRSAVRHGGAVTQGKALSMKSAIVCAWTSSRMT